MSGRRPAKSDLRPAEASRRFGQAISWVRSIHAGQFRPTEAVKGGIRYDPEAIRAYFGQICQRNARWDMCFARTGTTPDEVLSEDLTFDAQGAVDRVSRAFGTGRQPRIDPKAVRLQIRRDLESQVRRERFIAQRGDSNHVGSADFPAPVA